MHVPPSRLRVWLVHLLLYLHPPFGGKRYAIKGVRDTVRDAVATHILVGVDLV